MKKEQLEAATLLAEKIEKLKRQIAAREVWIDRLEKDGDDDTPCINPNLSYHSSNAVQGYELVTVAKDKFINLLESEINQLKRELKKAEAEFEKM